MDHNNSQQLRKKLIFAKYGTDAAINTCRLLNRELQAYFEHLSTVSEIVINEQLQRSVRLGCFFEPALLCSKKCNF